MGTIPVRPAAYVRDLVLATGLGGRPAVVLQIALATGEFRPGRYVREGSWHNGWKRDQGRP
jgi:hypothetical protein